MNKFAYLLATLCLCACTKNAPIPSIGQKESASLPASWQYSQIDSDWPIALALPSDSNIMNMGPVGYKISRDYYGEKRGELTGTGFAFYLDHMGGGFPVGFFNPNEGCPSGLSAERHWFSQEDGKKNGYIECTSGKRYFIITPKRVFGFYPAEQSERVLSIVEQVVKTAKITPEQ